MNTMFYATIKIFQLYRGGQFYWCKNTEYPQKTTDLQEDNDKLYYILAGFELTTLVMIGTGCTGIIKSNYHTITTTTALQYDRLTKSDLKH
jgi:hypothetical protein